MPVVVGGTEVFGTVPIHNLFTSKESLTGDTTGQTSKLAHLANTDLFAGAGGGTIVGTIAGKIALIITEANAVFTSFIIGTMGIGGAST